jgi:hypothetical protein
LEVTYGTQTFKMFKLLAMDNFMSPRRFIFAKQNNVFVFDTKSSLIILQLY